MNSTVSYNEHLLHSAEMEWLVRRDRYVSTHASHYVREMRIAAYSQMLESYSTLRLDTMSAAFGVSSEFLEKYTFLLQISRTVSNLSSLSALSLGSLLNLSLKHFRL